MLKVSICICTQRIHLLWSPLRFQQRLTVKICLDAHNSDLKLGLPLRFALVRTISDWTAITVSHCISTDKYLRGLFIVGSPPNPLRVSTTACPASTARGKNLSRTQKKRQTTKKKQVMTSPWPKKPSHDSNLIRNQTQKKVMTQKANSWLEKKKERVMTA